MSSWRIRFKAPLRVLALALTILVLNSDLASAQWRGGRGGFVGRGGWGNGRGWGGGWGGYGYRPGWGYGGYRGGNWGSFGLGVGLGYGLGAVTNNGYRYGSGYSGYYAPAYGAAPYATGRTYAPGDGYAYPLYYNPSTGRYVYYPR